MNSIFPFTVYSSDKTGGAPKGFLDDFLRVKMPGTWYAIDCEITSRSEVTFIVYDTWHNWYEGKGRKLYSVRATVDPSITLKYVDRRSITLACIVIKEQEEEEMQRRVKTLAYRLLMLCDK